MHTRLNIYYDRLRMDQFVLVDAYDGVPGEGIEKDDVERLAVAARNDR